MALSPELVSKTSGKLWAFVLRHPWSIGLSVLAATCFVKLASEVREGELGAVDAALTMFVIGYRGRFDPLMLALTYVGGGLGMTLLATLVCLSCWLCQRRTEAVFVAVAGIGTGAINSGLKLFFQRARPDADLLYLIGTPGSFSFPSGHAMGSAGVLASVVVVLYAVGLPRRLRVPVAMLASAFALGVAVSRVYFGVHYPSDLLGGQFAAAAWVSAVTGVFYPRLLPGERATPKTHDAVVEVSEQR